MFNVTNKKSKTMEKRGGDTVGDDDDERCAR
jgi:hypothetical protein